MKFFLRIGNVALLLGWLVGGVGEAAPVWQPEPVENALQGDTTITLDGNYTQSSSLTGNASLTVTGEFTLEFTEFQSYTGGTILEAGSTVKLNNSNASGVAAGILPNRIQINGGTLEIAAGGQMGYEKTATITVDQGWIRNTSNTHAILKDVYLSNGSMVEATNNYERTNWGGDFALDGNLYVTAGENTIKAEKIVLSARYSGLDNTVTMDVSAGASLLIDAQMNNPPSNTAGVSSTARSLRKTGEGTLKLLQNQFYTGGTVVEKGTVELAVASTALESNGSKPGLVLGTITVKEDGCLKMSSPGVMGYGHSAPVLDIQGGKVDNTTTGHNLLYKVTLSQGGVIQSDVTSITWGGNYALDGDITVTSGTNLIQAEKLVMSSRYTSVPYTNSFDIQGEETTLTVDGNLLNPTGTIDTRPRNLRKTGSGTLVLKGIENTYAGTTEILEGTLRIDLTGKKADAISLQSDVKIDGGQLKLLVDGAAADNLAITGKLQLRDVGSLTIDLGENLPLVDAIYPILSATEGIWLGETQILTTDDFAAFLSSEAQYYMNVISLDGGFALTTDSAAVPEPSSWILGILGLSFWWLRRRF